MTEEKVNNGQRVQVEHSVYSGPAGMVRTSAGWSCAVPRPPRGQAFGVGDPIKIDGGAWVIRTVSLSSTAPQAFVVLKVEENANG